MVSWPPCVWVMVNILCRFHRPVEGEEGYQAEDVEKAKADLSSLAQIVGPERQGVDRYADISKDFRSLGSFHSIHRRPTCRPHILPPGFTQILSLIHI